MKKILVLGGTRFFGRKLVELLLEQKHEVTIVTRGMSENPFGEAVEHIKSRPKRYVSVCESIGN